jgi:hypothetical protein
MSRVFQYLKTGASLWRPLAAIVTLSAAIVSDRFLPRRASKGANHGVPGELAFSKTLGIQQAPGKSLAKQLYECEFVRERE